MILQTLMLIGWLMWVPWSSPSPQTEGLDDPERRLETLQTALRDLGPTPAPDRRLYFNMECGLALLELERYSSAGALLRARRRCRT